MDKSTYKSYEKTHQQLVEAMQEACTKDTSRIYENPNVIPGFIYENYNVKANKTNSRINRFSKVAAVFIIVLLGMNLVMLTSDTSEVYGDKGLLHRIFEGTRGIFTDQDESEIVEFDETDKTFTMTDYSKLKDAKKFWPDLCVPEYIPKGYSFKQLQIVNNMSGDYFAEYDYAYNNRILEINVTWFGDDAKYSSNNLGEMIKLKDRQINIYWDEMCHRYNADVYFQNYTINICGNIDKNELISVASYINE